MAKNKRHKWSNLVHKGKIDFKEFDDFISENVGTDNELLTHLLMQSENEKLGFGDNLADWVADFGGSWTFIILFFLILGGWIVLNVFLIAQHPFDPYPFILLNLVLSCLAAIQAPIIMMSQNRKEDKDRQRAQNDYLINLKAELEIKNLQLNMEKLFENQKRQLELLTELKERMK